MQLWLNYLDQILLYAALGALAQPAARLRRPGLGGARRLRRHRWLHDGVHWRMTYGWNFLLGTLLGMVLRVRHRHARRPPGAEAVRRST